MREPHPLRCNMCNFRNIAHSEHCPYYQDAIKQKIKLDGFDWSELEIITEIIGCASHSSAKGDAVLEELYEWASSWHKDTPIRDVLLKKIAEFRQQQEREP